MLQMRRTITLWIVTGCYIVKYSYIYCNNHHDKYYYSQDYHHHPQRQYNKTTTLASISKITSVPQQLHESITTTTTTIKPSSWAKEMYPNPIIDPITCRASTTSSSTAQQQQQRVQGTATTMTSYICDPDALLTEHEIHFLQSKVQNTIALQKHHIHIHFVFLHKMMISNTTTTTPSSSSSSSFHVAEEFARYIYQRWIYHTSNNIDGSNTGSSSSSSNNNGKNNQQASSISYRQKSGDMTKNMFRNSSLVATTITPNVIDKYSLIHSPDEQKHPPRSDNFRQNKQDIEQIDDDDWNLLVFIARDDQMVYLARPTSQKLYDNTFPKLHTVDTILTVDRMERILFHHMMPYLQQQHYVKAMEELIHGIDFFLLYGRPKLWERILTILDRNDFYFEYILFYIVMTITILTGWIAHIWMNHNAVQQQLRLQEQQWTAAMNQGDSKDWSNKDEIIVIHPLNPTEYNRAERLRQRYHTQDACPICLEKIRCVPSESICTTTNKDVDEIDSSYDDNISDDDVQDIRTQQRMPQTYSSHRLDSNEIFETTLLRCGHVYHVQCWKTWMTYQYRRFCTRQKDAMQYANNNMQNNESDDDSCYMMKCLICQQTVDFIAQR